MEFGCPTSTCARTHQRPPTHSSTSVTPILLSALLHCMLPCHKCIGLAPVWLNTKRILKRDVQASDPCNKTRSDCAFFSCHLLIQRPSLVFVPSNQQIQIDLLRSRRMIHVHPPAGCPKRTKTDVRAHISLEFCPTELSHILWEHLQKPFLTCQASGLVAVGISRKQCTGFLTQIRLAL